jgi:PEP-CTERM motif
MAVSLKFMLLSLLPAAMLGGAGKSVTQFFSDMSVQVPEPGMMMLFGIGAGILGLKMGRGRPK